MRSSRAVKLSLPIAILWLTYAPCFSPADSPAANSSTTAPSNPLVTAVQQLADPDPALRESAREELMGITAADLPALRRAVQSVGPLQQEQLDRLPQIVEQVYLSGETSNTNPSAGFMGVKMRSDLDSVMAGDESDIDDVLGVIVEARVPGYSAYRMLRDGDVIQSIDSPGMGETRVRFFNDVVSRVKVLAPGQTVTLGILRGGRHIDVPVLLGARPKELEADDQESAFKDYKQELKMKAQAYWKANFAPVVENRVS